MCEHGLSFIRDVKLRNHIFLILSLPFINACFIEPGGSIYSLELCRLCNCAATASWLDEVELNQNNEPKDGEMLRRAVEVRNNSLLGLVALVQTDPLPPLSIMANIFFN